MIAVNPLSKTEEEISFFQVKHRSLTGCTLPLCPIFQAKMTDEIAALGKTRKLPCEKKLKGNSLIYHKQGCYIHDCPHVFSLF